MPSAVAAKRAIPGDFEDLLGLINIKFNANVARDQRVSARLRHLGWSVITVWECQLRAPERVGARLERLLAERG